MEWDIAYNTTQDELIIPEYGRTVQDLLRKANAIEDAADRQAYVERVIKLMLQMEPGIKTQDNYEERLWRHAFIIAGEPINVTVPEGITIAEEAEHEKVRLPYPDQQSRMKHYGHNVLQLIKAASALEDGPEKDQATYIAAYYMKIALTSWASGQFVNEEMIRKDLYELSEKKLMLGPEVKIGIPDAKQPEQHPTGRRKKNKKKSGGQTIQPPQNAQGGSRNKNRGNRNKRRR